MVIVESHHQVLEAWGKYRATLEQSPRVVTLDHHTDTSSPFRSFLKGRSPVEIETLRTEWLKNIQFKDPVSIRNAIAKLDHDEHIVTAIKTDIISSAFVIAQNAYDTDKSTYLMHRIMCQGVDRKIPSTGVTAEDCNVVLESTFLRQRVESFDQLLRDCGETALLDQNYILDIDLDYLNTKKSVDPLNSDFLKSLAKNAGLVTVAIETEHVAMCAREPGITTDFLLTQLLKLLEV